MQTILQKQTLWLALLMGLSYHLSAQSLERTVIGNAGNYQSNAAFGNLHWTVGEIAVETYQNSAVLSQGFHQAYYDLLVTPVAEIPDTDFSLKVFPNPTSGWIQLSTDLTGTLDISLVNLLGQQLFSQEMETPTGTIDLQSLPTGIYVLRVFRKEVLLGTFKIQKAVR